MLGSPELYRSTKAPMFLSLLFKVCTVHAVRAVSAVLCGAMLRPLCCFAGRHTANGATAHHAQVLHLHAALRPLAIAHLPCMPRLRPACRLLLARPHAMAPQLG